VNEATVKVRLKDLIRYLRLEDTNNAEASFEHLLNVDIKPNNEIMRII